MDSSVVGRFVVFVREPPLPNFKSASKDCNVFAYYYLHILLVSTQLRILLFNVGFFLMENVNIAEINLIARHIHCHA